MAEGKTKISFKIETFLITVYLAGVYFFPDRIKIVTAAFVLSFIMTELIKNRRIELGMTGVIWLSYIILALLSYAWGSGVFDDIFELIISFIIALMVSIFDFSEKERKDQIKGLIVLGFIVVLGCALQLLFPNTLRKINSFHLTSEKYNYFDEFYRNGKMVGFSFQTAITGFYLTLLFGIIFIKFICSARNNHILKNTFYVISLIGIYVLVFLTAKRIFIILIPCAVSILLCVLLKKHIGKIVICFSVMMAIMMLLLYKTDFGKALLIRSSGESWSTGRAQINEQMIELFWRHPLLGNGVCSTLVVLTHVQNAHNIYLQILSESGILGFILLITAFIIEIVKAVCVLSYAIKSKQNGEKILAGISLFSQIIFLGWGVTGNPLYDVYPFFVYMLSIGCVNSIRKKQKIKKGIGYGSWNYHILSQKQ